MIGFVTFVALFNLGLGYALAVFLGCGDGLSIRQILSGLRKQPASKTDPQLPTAVAMPAENCEPGAVAAVQIVAHSQPTTAALPVASVPVETPKSAGVPAKGLVTLDYVEQLVSELTAAGAETGAPTSIVLLELDSVEGGNDVATDRVLAGLAETIHGLLEDAHTAARFADQRFVLLLPGDDQSHATQRAEQVRQRIEATEFIADQQQIHATVSCASAQVVTDSATPQLMRNLQEAIAQAKKLGGNRTFQFNGATPTPVVPPELNLSPQKCAI